MHFIRLLLILPQLLAMSSAQTSFGLQANLSPPLGYSNRTTRTLNSVEETTKSASTATTNIFERFLTKSTTRSSVENPTQFIGNTINTTTEGLWFIKTAVNKTSGTSTSPATTTKRSFQPTYFNILTKYTTISTAPTKTTEISAAATNTTMIIPTTTSTTAKTTMKTTTTTTKTPSTTRKSIISNTINHAAAPHHFLHSAQNLSTTTIKSIAKAEWDLDTNGSTKLKLHFAMIFVVLTVIGNY